MPTHTHTRTGIKRIRLQSYYGNFQHENRFIESIQQFKIHFGTRAQCGVKGMGKNISSSTV